MHLKFLTPLCPILVALASTFVGCSDGALVMPDNPDVGSQRILFTGDIVRGTYEGNIYSSLPDGSGRARITTGILVAPPNDSRFVYMVPAPGDRVAVMTAKLDGSDPMRFREFALLDAGVIPVALTPDGANLLYVAKSVDAFLGDTLAIASIDGNGAETIASGHFFSDEVALSPEGKRVAYFLEGRNGLDGTIEVVDLDGMKRTTIVAGIVLGEPRRINWSPSGNRLVYAAFDSSGAGTADIWSVAVNGGAPVNLTNDSLDQIVPVWSPDGTRIAFTQGPGTYDLWTMRADGTDRRVAVSGTDDAEFFPNWSSDGKRILFKEGIKRLSPGSIELGWGEGAARVVNVASGAVTTVYASGGIPFWIP